VVLVAESQRATLAVAVAAVVAVDVSSRRSCGLWLSYSSFGSLCLLPMLWH
jgi:hypothetical protein